MFPQTINSLEKIMSRKKVLVVTGSRAEYGLLRPVLHELHKSKKLVPRLLVTGMHTLKKYGYTLREVRREFPVDANVPIQEKDSMLAALATEIQGIENAVKKERPDLLLVLGDRDEAFAGAIVGGHEKIPVAHIHGGDTLGFLVDESIRHSITKFAHIHFPATKKSAQRIVQMGENPRHVHVVGSTAFDARELERIGTRTELARELGLDSTREWLLVIQHPTPLDSTPINKQLLPTLKAIKNDPAQKVIVYPNSDTGSKEFIRSIEHLRQKNEFIVVPSLPRRHYLGLMKESVAIIGNSSSGIIEAGFFKKAVVNIGGRQAGRECGENVIHADYSQAEITRAIAKARSKPFTISLSLLKHPYGLGNAAMRLVRILEKAKIEDNIFHKRFHEI